MIDGIVKVKEKILNINKARKILKWKPSININSLIDEMITEEYKNF